MGDRVGVVLCRPQDAAPVVYLPIFLLGTFFLKAVPALQTQTCGVYGQFLQKQMYYQVQFPAAFIPSFEKQLNLNAKPLIFAIDCSPSVEFSLQMVLPLSSL